MICIKNLQTNRFQIALLALGSLLAVAALEGSASAGLIANTARFNAYVRNSGGDGPIADIEEHFTGATFDEDDDMVPLPAINANLVSPFDDAEDLRVRIVDSGGAELNGQDYVDSVFWVTSQFGKVIVNDDSLDTTIPPPNNNVKFETFVYLAAGNDNEDEDDEDQLLGIDEKLFIAGVRYEDGPCALCSPSLVSISNNRGSIDDPIHLVIELDGEDVLSFLKLHVFWTTMDRPIVPEPTTGLLTLAGAAGLAVVARRRR